MKVVLKTLRETIDPSPGQSFRVIRWASNPREVESLQADGSLRKIAGEGVHWHHHPEMELTLFTKGEGTRFVGDHIAAFAAGDLVLLGGNLPHYWHVRGRSAGISIQWHFPPSHPLWAFPELHALAPVFSRAQHGIRLTGKTAAGVSAALMEMGSGRAADRLPVLLRLFSLLAAMPKRDAARLSSRSFGLSPSSRHQAAIARAVKQVISGFREEIRLDDLLRLTGMSRPTFARQFKEHAGRTLSEFINELRLQAACRELLASDRGILEIALDCGFNQISFFNRLFRREKGCSPREYRARR